MIMTFHIIIIWNFIKINFEISILTKIFKKIEHIILRILLNVFVYQFLEDKRSGFFNIQLCIQS